MAQMEGWVSLAEASRICGLSPRTLRGLEKEGRLAFHRSPGGHVRIARADLDGLLRHPANATTPAAAPSAVLQNRRERVEELKLQAEEVHARRDLETLLEQDADRKRERSETRRAQREDKRLQLETEQARLARDREERNRQIRQLEEAQKQAAFEKRWIQWTREKFALPGFSWLSADQRNHVLEVVSREVETYTPTDEAIIADVLSEVIARLCAPWKLEYEVGKKREKVIESALYRLPHKATDAERVQAATDVRSALSQASLAASDFEIQSTVGAALEPILKTITQRLAREEADAREKQAREEAEREKTRKRDARQFRKSCRVTDGISRVDSYLSELYSADEIDSETYLDSVWRAELKERVRDELESALEGSPDETKEDAEELAEEIVDEELA